MQLLSDTDKRIIKLFRRGTSLASIARKIGRPGDVDRVKRAIRKVIDNFDELDIMEGKDK